MKLNLANLEIVSVNVRRDEERVFAYSVLIAAHAEGFHAELRVDISARPTRTTWLGRHTPYSFDELERMACERIRASAEDVIDADNGIAVDEIAEAPEV
jgi:hypothetical protein